MTFPGYQNPPPPPPRKLKDIVCSGCGATHNQEKCPYCGSVRQNCECGLVPIMHVYQKQSHRLYCSKCGQEIIPVPSGHPNIDYNIATARLYRVVPTNH